MKHKFNSRLHKLGQSMKHLDHEWGSMKQYIESVSISLFVWLPYEHPPHCTRTIHNVFETIYKTLFVSLYTDRALMETFDFSTHKIYPFENWFYKSVLINVDTYFHELLMLSEKNNIWKKISMKLLYCYNFAMVLHQKEANVYWRCMKLQIHLTVSVRPTWSAVRYYRSLRVSR